MCKKYRDITFAREENKSITLSAGEIVDILRELDYISLSLENIYNYYGFSCVDNIGNGEKNFNMCKEIANFFCKNNIIEKIISSGHILSEKFNDDIIENINMGDLEKELEDIKFWEKPGD